MTAPPPPTITRVQAQDGTGLHVELTGEGPFDVLQCDGIGCSGFIWKHITPWLAERGARIIHPHMRGHGDSDLPQDPGRVAIADVATDMVRILDEVDSQGALVMGHSMGVQVALDLWRQAPDRVKGLVLICGSFENPVATFHDGPVLARLLPVLRALSPAMGGPVKALWQKLVPTALGYEVAVSSEIHPDYMPRADMMKYLEDLARVDPRVFVRMLAGAEGHSAAPVLGHIGVPCLIIAGQHDKFTPAWLSEQMARRIPTAQLHTVIEGTHAAPVEHPIDVEHVLDRFVRTNGWFQ